MTHKCGDTNECGEYRHKKNVTSAVNEDSTQNGDLRADVKAEMGDVDDKDMREYYAGDVSGGSDNEMNVAVLEEDG